MKTAMVAKKEERSPNLEGGGVIQVLTKFFTALMREYLPDPFVFVILLTALTVVLGGVLQRKTPIEMIGYWGKGFWSMLAFTAQAVTMLATGYVLAKAPLVDKGINQLSRLLKTPRGAIIAATLVGGVGSYINWGFGLIVGAVVARKLAVAIRGVHYPLIMAAAYTGFVLYGFGFSSTIPILIATNGHPLESAMGTVPLSNTIFNAPILITALVLLLTLPVLNVLAMPRNPEDIIELDPNVFEDAENDPTSPLLGTETVAWKLNNSRLLCSGMGLFGLLYLARYFYLGGSLDYNSNNLTLLFGGLLLMGTTARYTAALAEGAKTVGGIILQYPCYAAIMAMLAGSGLVGTIAEWFVHVSNVYTLPIWGLASSFVINFFAPAAGGHWVIQGPFMIEAAKALGTDLGKTSMSVMLGNAWNDLIQPFWLIPTLAISGLKLSDVMPYTVIAMLWSGVVIGTGILIWSFF
jgi:short-chain fatty acids transporter